MLYKIIFVGLRFWKVVSHIV